MDDSEAGISGAVTEDFNVFLNHRGPDVKATFVSHLEDALHCAGFRPFLDAHALMKGNPALASIDEALATAKVHVAVVSPGYAQSKYCLDELVAMLRSGKPVVPVFYGVEPVDLRWVDQGPFVAAFEGDKVKRTEERVGEWRKALSKLADITGFRLADYRSDEAKLKREVVKQIACLTSSNDPIEVEECRVGLESRTKKCVEMLESMGTGVGILGLVGMGGVGKTTLAREIYNRFVVMNKFVHMTFLEMHQVSMSSSNVEVRPNKTRKLRSQLLWDLLRMQSESPNYKSWFEKVSRVGPVFIVMDDVHKQDQFRELLPCASLLHQGSRILITSRDKSILKSVGGIAKVDLQIYDVSQLNWNKSYVLFNWHAFHGYDAPDDFKDVTKDVVKACSGLPLALKVIGSSLCDKKSKEDRQTIWVEAVDALKQSKGVIGVLRWSYDFLSDKEKHMFLDIMCMFYNGSVEEALAYWRSCASSSGIKTPHTFLQSLMDKNLVKKNWRGQFEIHDLIRDVGLEIGRKSKSHLICNDMDDGIALAKKGVEETVVLNLAKSQKRKFDASMFSKMPNLHHLILPNKCRVIGDLRCISKELRRLQWREAPFGCIPTTLSLIHLLELDFSWNTNLASSWTEADNCFEGCPNLRLLNLEGCTSITRLPNSIGQLKALESLVIDQCTSLKAIPDSLGLSNLTNLQAYRCHSLLGLPTSIGQSSRLQRLSLRYCTSLEKLPKSIGQLHALKLLSLDGCISLKALPNTIGDLSNLENLFLIGCRSLMKVPYSSIGLLQRLRMLYIELGTECQGFADGTLGTIWAQLETLYLRNCTGLGSGLNYDALGSLQCLNLSDRTLTELPESLGLLICLEILVIFYCERLKIEKFPQSFGDLTYLKDLTLSNCKSLRRLPKDWGPLTRLRQLTIDCCSIKRLPKSISCLSRLLELKLEECKSLQKLPTFIKHFKHLRLFRLIGCGTIEAMGALTTLQGLPIWGSTSLTHLPTSLQMVTDLHIYSDNYYDYSYDGTSYEVLEEDESGYLRAYRNILTRKTTLVRRPHKENILLTDLTTSSESDGSTSDGSSSDGSSSDGSSSDGSASNGSTSDGSSRD